MRIIPKTGRPPWYAAIAGFLPLLAVMGQTTNDRATYLTQIAELQRIGPELARREGKEAVIQRYRALVDANPGQPNNIQLETQIGLIYETDLSDAGEPPNLRAAYDTYLGIIDTYDPSSPYMKHVRQMAADRAVELDPGAAQDQYLSLIEDYPNDDPVVVASYFNLGRLAEQNGDMDTAREYYENVLNHVPGGEPLSQAEQATVDTYEANAALSLLAEVIRKEPTPEGRVAAIKAFLEKHPDLANTQSDLVERLLKTVEGTSEEQDNQPLKQAIDTLVRMVSDKRNRDATMSSEERSSRLQDQGLAALDEAARSGDAANALKQRTSRPGDSATRQGAESGVSDEARRGGSETKKTSEDETTTPPSNGDAPWALPLATVVAVATVLALLIGRRKR